MIIHILSLLIATLLLVGCESTDDSVDTYSYERDSYNWDETYEIDSSILNCPPKNGHKRQRKTDTVPGENTQRRKRSEEKPRAVDIA